jgi:hypothetical protein
MGNVYRVTRPDGSVEYTDTPQGQGDVQAVDERGRVVDHALVKDVIKQVQKRAVKINDYLDYLVYLRDHRPHQLDRVLLELKQTDPEAWLKLQKYPQFRPLRQTTLGLKATEKHIKAAIGMATGKVGGSLEGWLETTVKDMMKRDRWGPYADVLGSKASTLPQKTPSYSNSRLGQYLKVEDARAAKAAAAAAKDAESARAALRAAKATAVTRALNPLLDLGIEALNPEVARGVGTEVLRVKARRLYEKGVLDVEQWAHTQELISQGRFVELQQFLEEQTGLYVKGRP